MTLYRLYFDGSQEFPLHIEPIEEVPIHPHDEVYFEDDGQLLDKLKDAIAEFRAECYRIQWEARDIRINVNDT